MTPPDAGETPVPPAFLAAVEQAYRDGWKGGWQAGFEAGMQYYRFESAEPDDPDDSTEPPEPGGRSQ